MLRYYEHLQSAYGWTMQEVDAHEISFLLEQMVVLSLLQDKKREKFIDDVM